MEVKRMNETVQGESGNKIPLCSGGMEQLGGGGRGGAESDKSAPVWRHP